MYSAPCVAVDKKVSVEEGLGFDFSGLTDLFKSAATTGLNIYQNQLQLKQVQEMQKNAVYGGYAMPTAGQYGQQYGILPMGQVLQPRPTFGAPMPYTPPTSGGVSTNTMMMMGVGVLGALVLFKVLAK